MTIALEILKKIQVLTMAGQIAWSISGPDVFTCETPGGSIQIEFLYPVYGGEASTGADVAKVKLARVELTFYEGTTGMELIRSILTNAIPGFSEHSKLI